VVAGRFLREPENRERLVRRLERIPVIRSLVPELRFFWRRFTPGGLGLEFTSLMAILSVSLFVLVGYISIVAPDHGPTPGDVGALDLSRDLYAEWLVDVAEVVTVLGGTPVTLAVAAIAGAVLARKRRWTEVSVLVAALVIVHVAVPVLKDAVDRPRPLGALVDTDRSAFPSGHATYSVIYAWLAATIAVRVRPGMANASLLIAAGIALAAVIGLSRVYLRVHFLSDVSSGWALGVSAFAACAAVAMIVGHFRKNQARIRTGPAP
jgi:undecaprenyl-diphosphatase